MRGEPTGFWAKLVRGEDGTIAEWHPFRHHAADVAAVTEALLSLPLWSRRLAALAGLNDLNDVQRARLAVLAALHDMGKLALCFQAKGRTDLGLTSAGHVSAGVGAFHAKDVRQAMQFLRHFGEGAEGFLLAALGHHGRPVSARSAPHQNTWWRPRAGLDPLAELQALLQSCRVWFPGAFSVWEQRHSAASCDAGLPDIPALQHAFAGLVMLADWIASDTTFFPFGNPENDRMPFARLHARAVLERTALTLPVDHRRDPCGRNPFARICGEVPRAAQALVLGLPPMPQGSVVVLESDTGSGKTEAALAHFVRLYTAGEVDGLYFALPTRTAATQIFERVRQAVARAFENPPPVTLAVPGYLRVDDREGQRLAPFDVLWPDDDQERFRYRAWAAETPKRYLAAPIAVGTIDQVLLSSLMVPHAHLRATALLRHLLVVDEVHASDAYMIAILQNVLARHIAAGGHALLLSATLGAAARHRLLKAGSRSLPSAVSGVAEACSTSYPLLSWRAGTASAVQSRSPEKNDGRQRCVGVTASAHMEDPDAVARMASEQARRGARVLVVRNTVTDCVATQQAVEDLLGADAPELFRCVGVPAPHHGRFAADDRRVLDAALEARMGKLRDSDGPGCVVVATQTVQQSLDIDADFMLTDLCPADVLLQRLGRLHRHERRRPPGFEQPRAVVLVPVDRDLARLIDETGRARSHHGLGSVYDDLRVVEATWRVVERERCWRIPEMSRQIVEQCVHPEALHAITETDDRFRKHEQYVVGELLAERRQAELNLVEWSRRYDETPFPESGDERIQTRLGEGDRRVSFERPVAGPFGIAVSELTLPAWWCRNADANAATEMRAATPGSVRFRFGGREFTYDRFGVRPDGGRTASSEGVEAEYDDGP